MPARLEQYGRKRVFLFGDSPEAKRVKMVDDGPEMESVSSEAKLKIRNGQIVADDKVDSALSKVPKKTVGDVTVTQGTESIPFGTKLTIRDGQIVVDDGVNSAPLKASKQTITKVTGSTKSPVRDGSVAEEGEANAATGPSLIIKDGEIVYAGDTDQRLVHDMSDDQQADEVVALQVTDSDAKDPDEMVKLFRDAALEVLSRTEAGALDRFENEMQQEIRPDPKLDAQVRKVVDQFHRKEASASGRPRDELLFPSGSATAKLGVLMHYPTYYEGSRYFFDPKNGCIRMMMKKGFTHVQTSSMSGQDFMNPMQDLIALQQQEIETGSVLDCPQVPDNLKNWAQQQYPDMDAEDMKASGLSIPGAILDWLQVSRSFVVQDGQAISQSQALPIEDRADVGGSVSVSGRTSAHTQGMLARVSAKHYWDGAEVEMEGARKNEVVLRIEQQPGHPETAKALRLVCGELLNSRLKHNDRLFIFFDTIGISIRKNVTDTSVGELVWRRPLKIVFQYNSGPEIVEQVRRELDRLQRQRAKAA